MSEGEFRVETPEQAAWAMRKYRKLAQKLQRNVDMADHEKRRIEAWLDRVNEPIASQLEFFEGHLNAYAMSERAKGNKSLDFTDGSIKTRQSSATFEVDKAVFIEWAQENKRDDVIRASYAPDMSGIKSALLADGNKVIDPLSGEIVPGILPVPERVTTRFEPDMDALDLEGMDDDDAIE